MKPTTLQEVTDYLVTQLKAHGISLLYYHAYSTNSRYCKLDEGVLHTIRISDHHGKRHLKYRYEIGPHIPHKTCIRKQGFPYYQYNSKEVDQLIEDIFHERKILRHRYGNLYEKFRQDNLANKKSQKGFWSQAKYI